jgi:hypothetical protein
MSFSIVWAPKKMSEKSPHFAIAGMEPNKYIYVYIFLLLRVNSYILKKNLYKI